MKERRKGVNLIPVGPDQQLNDHQIHGLIILKKFGWGFVCIRWRSESSPVMILKNILDKTYGILNGNGILELSSDIRIRDPHKLV